MISRAGDAARDVVPLKLAEFPYPEGHPLAGRPGVLFAFAIRVAGRTLLYDTGIGFGNAWVDATIRHNTRDVRNALRDGGIDPATVTHVVNSHLHFDHCGQNRSFVGVPIVVQRAEHQASRADGYTVREWVDFPGATYQLVEGDVELAAGVRVLATPGHTPGHQSLAVQTRDGLTVLAGHAIWSADEYAGVEEPHERSAEAVASADRLRALRPARVLFSHHWSEWRPQTEAGWGEAH